MQLQKSSEEREGKVEELSQELKAARKEIGRLQPLEQRVKDLLGNLKQTQIDKDRYLSLHHFCFVLRPGLQQLKTTDAEFRTVCKNLSETLHCLFTRSLCSCHPCAACMWLLAT